MLVYHTDPHIDGILGTVEMNLFLIDKDLTAGRLIESAEHIHHGTLSGSVLSQDRMYLSFVYGQIDVVVGCKVAEFLHDVLHLNDYFTRIHMACSSHVYCLLCISFIYLYRIAMRFRFCLQWTGKSQIIFSIKDRIVQTLFSICTDGALHTQAPYRTTHILLCFRMH